MKPLADLEALLSSSGLLVYGRFSSEGNLLCANLGLKRLINGRAGGRNLADLLVEGQREQVAHWLAQGGDAEWPDYLHFDDDGGMPISLFARVAWDGDELLLFAEPAIDDLAATQARLMALNSQVSDLARGSAKRTAELEKVLDELHSSHWHLKRLELLLPMCSYCGRVRVGPGEWRSVESYLHENSDFLTHGVCPDCAASIEVQVRE